METVFLVLINSPLKQTGETMNSITEKGELEPGATSSRPGSFQMLGERTENAADTLSLSFSMPSIYRGDHLVEIDST